VARRKLRLGVSACLLGSEVRYDGRHKRNAWLVDVLGPLVEWVAVCPEVELGLGVPREPIRLLRRPGRSGASAPRLVGARSRRDLTLAMRRYALVRVRELEALDLDGFVAKSGSPSCGLVEVPIHGARGGRPRREGVGMFVAALVTRLPGLPIEEERRLEDPETRKVFLGRIRAYARSRRPSR
jgi:uncharacterized protein YbbK (DUF523 family)